MFETDAVLTLLQTHGLSLVAVLSLIEGPIVSVIAGYLATLGVFHFAALIPVLILGDLLGDIAFYGLGRYGQHLLPRRLAGRIDQNLSDQFERRGGRILAIGKLTHAAGAAVLVSAGAARMRLAPFMLFNTLATVPKVVAFVAIGAVFGQAHEQISQWIGQTSLVLLALAALGIGGWFWIARKSR